MKKYIHRFKNPHLNRLADIHNIIASIGSVRAFFIGLLCPEFPVLCDKLAELTKEIGKECGE